MDNPYIQQGKNPLLVGDMPVNLGDILVETSKNSACWDMGGNCHLTYGCSLTAFIIIPSCIGLELESNNDVSNVADHRV